RLVDPALEQQLATGDIVPLAIITPEIAPPLESKEIAMSRAGSRNRTAGTLLHRILERWDGKSQIDPLVTALAAEIGANAPTIARVRQRLAVLARSKTWQRIAAAETIGRELTMRVGDEERRIDRLIRENGREVVIDYKSGTPRPKDEDQMQRYCALIAQITGQPCEGVVWYLDIE